MYESDARSSRDCWIDLKNPFQQIPGSICAPRGFKASAVFCDIKRLGTGKGSEKGQKRDLALIVSDVPAAVAGKVFPDQGFGAPGKRKAEKTKRKIPRRIAVHFGKADD